jgi:hypothetical protein
MNLLGNTAKLDEFISFWKSSTCIFIVFCVVENGSEAIDERCMSPQDKINCELNSSTDKICQCLKQEIYDRAANIEPVKEVWPLG